MARTDFRDIDAYHSCFEGEPLKRMEAIRALIHRVVPGVQEVISYQIPAFKTGKQFFIYYAAFKQHISLSHPWSDALLKTFEPELKNLKVSRAAIQFPHKEALPLDFIERLLQFRKQETEANLNASTKSPLTNP
ncbi:MAG: DUF1801 domain-containing protein [Sphingobacteriales bacterium]|nr:MAG: DUF1801 domain-containing protein [Sphingobacteriales bacterium]